MTSFERGDPCVFFALKQISLFVEGDLVLGRETKLNIVDLAGLIHVEAGKTTETLMYCIWCRERIWFGDQTHSLTFPRLTTLRMPSK